VRDGIRWRDGVREREVGRKRIEVRNDSRKRGIKDFIESRVQSS
jgi:hypothetical protein